MTAPASPRPADALDSRIAASLQLEADVRALVARQRLASGVAAEFRHLFDPADRAFAALACACPDGCSCPDDYPTWTPGVRPTTPKEATT